MLVGIEDARCMCRVICVRGGKIAAQAHPHVHRSDPPVAGSELRRSKMREHVCIVAWRQKARTGAVVLGGDALRRTSRSAAVTWTRPVCDSDEREEDPRIDDTDDQTTQCAPFAILVQMSVCGTSGTVLVDAPAACVVAARATRHSTGLSAKPSLPHALGSCTMSVPATRLVHSLVPSCQV